MPEPNPYAAPKSEPVASHIIRNSVILVVTGLVGVLIGSTQIAGRELERRDRVSQLRGYEMEELLHEHSLTSQVYTLKLLKAGKVKEAISHQEFMLSDSIIKLGGDAELPIERSINAKKALYKASLYITEAPDFKYIPGSKPMIDHALSLAAH